NRQRATFRGFESHLFRHGYSAAVTQIAGCPHGHSASTTVYALRLRHRGATVSLALGDPGTRHEWTRMTIMVYGLKLHAPIRAGMLMNQSFEADIEVVCEAESSKDALPEIRALKPDNVLCDQHLPGVSGLEVTGRIFRGEYGPKVIVVS